VLSNAQWNLTSHFSTVRGLSTRKELNTQADVLAQYADVVSRIKAETEEGDPNRNILDKAETGKARDIIDFGS